MNGSSAIDEERQGHRHVGAFDGVRGIAVVLVLLFHLEVGGFAAGFLGVDVFFVLSGFLITGLLLADVDRHGRVSLSGFWARRIRRLAPALVVVLLTVAAVTWLTASPLERSTLRGDLLAATAYGANWRFIESTSYFENTGAESPLQHFWSLAIEEQFYFVWPLVIAAVVALAARRRHLSIAVVALVLAAASAILLFGLWRPGAPERAYMGTDARIFEPLIGALGALAMTTAVARRWVTRAGPLLSTAAGFGLVAALVLIRPGEALYFTGGALAVSVLTVLLVAPLWVDAGGSVGRAFAWRPLVWLGVISYGIYLWHWPFIVWFNARDASGWTRVWTIALVVGLTLAVATLSYHFIERPIRSGNAFARFARRPVRERRVVLASVPVALLLVAGTSLAATTAPGIGPGTPVVMLTGDSVPLQLELALEEASLARGWRLVSAAQGGCPVTGERPTDTWGNLVPAGAACPDIVVAEQDALIAEADPDVVVWWDRWSLSTFVTASGNVVEAGSAAFWELRASTLDDAVQRLSRNGAAVLLVATEPPGMAMAELCADASQHCPRWYRFLIAHYDDITTRWNELLRSYAARHADLATFVSVTDQVCRTDQAPCDDTTEGVPARPEGIHYAGAGEDDVVGLLIGDLGPLLVPGEARASTAADAPGT